MIKTYGEITPRDYQWEAHQATAKHIRTSRDPVIVNATVGAGKSLLIAMVCHRVAEMGHRALVITRQGEIAEQDSEEMWNAGVKNSLFSASLGKKSTYYPIVVGTEGTVCRALDNQLADFAPLFLFIDECVTGDTLISTSKGKMRIDDPELTSAKIMCVNESDGSICFDRPVRVFTNGTKRVSLIKLDSGEVLRCTDTHKLFCRDSWVRARFLKNGDELTLRDSHGGVMKRLLRASAAVARRLFQIARQDHL